MIEGEIRKHRGGKRRDGRHPKGRQLEDSALEEVRALLGDRPRRRDLLIEHLHLIQDRYGHLSAAHVAALAHEMRLAQTEVYEVATFYAHFDVVKEDETPPPALTVRVCDSLTCELMGAQALLAALKASLDPSEVRVVRAPCMGRCDTAPVAELAHQAVDHATPDKIADLVRHGESHPAIPPYADFDAYRAGGGYGLIEACRAGEHSFESLTATLNDAGLRGLGGAGFPTGRKWGFVRNEPKPRYLAVNADEGEPGTFKDRWYLERDPHRVLEGMLVAAWAIEAEAAYFYLRDEYPAVRKILLREIPKLEAAGLAPEGFIRLRRGAGAYICGEESSMLESIEGKRGLPRHRPPYAAQVGLFGRPTLINNVETLFWIRDIVEKGAAWFADQGRRGSKGAAQLLGLGPGQVAGRQARPGRRHGARADRGVLRRHGRRPSLRRLSAGRRLGRHPARLDGRPPARLRQARGAWLLRRLACGRDPVGPGRSEGRGAQPPTLLRGRELRPMHTVPGRLRESRQADGARPVGRGAARGVVQNDGRRLDLRPRPSRPQPDPLGAEVLRRAAARLSDAAIDSADTNEFADFSQRYFVEQRA